MFVGWLLLQIPLDRLLYRSGQFASRTAAREAISCGRVSVNGNQITRNNMIDPSVAAERILLDGSPLPPPPPQVVLALHKPRGVETTCSPDAQSRTIMDYLPAADFSNGVRPVGRLDADSEGLLLFTNDGSLAQLLLQPGRGCEKRYIALASPRYDIETPAADFARSRVKSLVSGIELTDGYVGRAERCRVLDLRSDAVDDEMVDDEMKVAASELAIFGGLVEEGRAQQQLLPGQRAGQRALQRRQQPRVLIEVVMTQGAKREVRRLLKAVGLRTIRLCRTSIGGVTLQGVGGCEGLRSGECVTLRREELLGLYASAAALGEPGLPVYDSERSEWVAADEMLPPVAPASAPVPVPVPADEAPAGAAPAAVAGSNARTTAAAGWCHSCGREHSIERTAAAEAAALALLTAVESAGRFDFDAPAPNDRFRVDALTSGKMLGVLLCSDGTVLRAFSGMLGGAPGVLGTWECPGWVDSVATLTLEDAEPSRRFQEIVHHVKAAESSSSEPQRSEHRRMHRSLSRSLSHDLAASVTLQNARAEAITLPELLDLRDQPGPGEDPDEKQKRQQQQRRRPGGIGDCAAPKLLMAAHRLGLTPMAMAEIWFEAPGRREALATSRMLGGSSRLRAKRRAARPHGSFHPACSERCEPIMGFLLCGLDEVVES